MGDAVRWSKRIDVARIGPDHEQDSKSSGGGDSSPLGLEADMPFVDQEKIRVLFLRELNGLALAWVQDLKCRVLR